MGSPPTREQPRRRPAPRCRCLLPRHGRHQRGHRRRRRPDLPDLRRRLLLAVRHPRVARRRDGAAPPVDPAPRGGRGGARAPAAARRTGGPPGLDRRDRVPRPPDELRLRHLGVVAAGARRPGACRARRLARPRGPSLAHDARPSSGRTPCTVERDDPPHHRGALVHRRPRDRRRRLVPVRAAGRGALPLAARGDGPRRPRAGRLQHRRRRPARGAHLAPGARDGREPAAAGPPRLPGLQLPHLRLGRADEPDVPRLRRDRRAGRRRPPHGTGHARAATPRSTRRPGGCGTARGGSWS